jgi:hypothetical protein
MIPHMPKYDSTSDESSDTDLLRLFDFTTVVTPEKLVVEAAPVLPEDEDNQDNDFDDDDEGEGSEIDDPNSSMACSSNSWLSNNNKTLFVSSMTSIGIVPYFESQAGGSLHLVSIKQSLFRLQHYLTYYRVSTQGSDITTEEQFIASLNNAIISCSTLLPAYTSSLDNLHGNKPGTILGAINRLVGVFKWYLLFSVKCIMVDANKQLVYTQVLHIVSALRKSYARANRKSRKIDGKDTMQYKVSSSHSVFNHSTAFSCGFFLCSYHVLTVQLLDNQSSNAARRHQGNAGGDIKRENSLGR